MHFMCVFGTPYCTAFTFNVSTQVQPCRVLSTNCPTHSVISMQDHTTIGKAEFLHRVHGHEPGAWTGKERAAIVTVFCSKTRCLRLVSPKNLVKGLRGVRISVSSTMFAVSYTKSVTRLSQTPHFSLNFSSSLNIILLFGTSLLGCKRRDNSPTAVII
jgi:hypothetical protein